MDQQERVKVVYVAGPFRGQSAWDIEQNIRRAEALSLEVWRLGAAALCPHTNTRFFQNAAPDDVWLKGDIELLRRCDAVIMTPDWERSSGARAERDFAKDANIPVFYSLDTLRAWMTEYASTCVLCGDAIPSDGEIQACGRCVAP